MKIFFKLAVALLLLILCSQSLYAARYNLTLIDEPLVSAINNRGTVVGINSDGLPFIWQRNVEDNTYPPETDVPEADRIYKQLLPTDTFLFSEIHVLDINNELEVGSGGSVVGWYIDENGLRQSILWHLEENNRNEFKYVALLLPAHQLAAGYCAGGDEESVLPVDFTQPECMYPQDSDLIYRASLCEINKDWVFLEREVFVDMGFKYGKFNDDGTPIPDEIPDCSNSLPICQFKIERVQNGTKEIQGETGNITVPAFIYTKNKPYADQECVLAEHAEFIKQATQCNNNDFNEPGNSLTIKCDQSSQAIGINNENMIIGTSFKPEGGNRPIFWTKSANKTDDGKPKYNTGDLGTQRTANDIDSSLSSDPINGTISQSVDTIFRNGYPTAIDKMRNSIVGMLHTTEDIDSPLEPAYWTGVAVGGFAPPEFILAPAPKTLISQACVSKDDPIKFVSPVTLTSLATGRAIGWYEDPNQNPKPVMWTSCPTTITNEDGSQKIVELLTPGHIPTLDPVGDRYIGKALKNNAAGATVGTTLVDIPDLVDENNIQLSENHAFFRTTTCGIQDLNGLLEIPFDDRSLILESAYDIATGVPPSSILALGRVTETETVNSYILIPKEVFVDLEATVSSDNDKLTVGDQHTITVTIVNKGAVDNEGKSNYATCVFFKLSSTVFTQTAYEDKIKEFQDKKIPITDAMDKEFAKLPKIADELVGGLSFDVDWKSNKKEKINCRVSHIDIVCAIERIDPGASNAITVSVTTTPRPLLADRTIRTVASVFATEKESTDTLVNNTAFELIDVKREACFIATAAYGSYLVPEVEALREFRDNVLLQSTLGTHLVNFYYDTSPPIANFIAQNESLRSITRWALSPVIYAVAYPTVSILFIISIGFGIKRVRTRRLQKEKVA